MCKIPVRVLYAVLVLFLPFLSYAQITQYQYNSSIGGLSDLIIPQLFEVDNNNNVYILEQEDYESGYNLKKFNSRNELISDVKLTISGSSSTNSVYFSAFRCSPAGQLLALDSYGGMIYVFGQDGNLTKELYLYDIEEILEGSLYYPSDMIVSDNNTIYILYSNGIAGLDFEGNVISLWMFEEYLNAYSLTIDKRGNLYVSFDLSILVLAPDGTVINTISTYIPLPEIYIRQIVSDGYDRLFITYGGYYSNVYAIYRTDGKEIASYQDGHLYTTESGETIYVSFSELSQIAFKNQRLYIGDSQYDNKDSIFQYDRIAIFDEIKLEPFAIHGPGRIPINTPVTYKILPELDGQYLYCKYTGTNVEQVIPFDFSSGDESQWNITLIASPDATRGRLVCMFESSQIEQDSIYLDITPYVPARPYSISPVSCDTEDFVLCGDGSIKSFSFNNISKSNIHCNGYGYKDYTMDNLVASAHIGQLYSATIFLDTDHPSLPYYAGIWIDLNNDGDFDDDGEFAGTSIAFDGIVKFINIQIPQYSDYTGDARMRVRSRVMTPFSAGESCMRKGDIGETQDYAVQITQSLSLAASEVITPNNDGKNDHFVIQGVDHDYDNKLVITDSYGKVIRQMSNYTNDWPSQNDRSILPSGTYYYFFENGPGSINGFFIVNY